MRHWMWIHWLDCDILTSAPLQIGECQQSKGQDVWEGCGGRGGRADGRYRSW